MIEYVFYFNEGNVTSKVFDESEDHRVQTALAMPEQKWFKIKGDPLDFMVNLQLVKVVSREVKADEVLPEVPPQEQISI